MRKLLCIEDVFAIEGRGLVLSPDLPVGSPKAAHSAEIRRRDGSVVPVQLQVVAEIRSLTLDAVRAGVRSSARVCLIKGVAKSDVVIGSELWCDDAFAQDVLGDETR